jgi:hypothetical protein
MRYEPSPQAQLRSRRETAALAYALRVVEILIRSGRHAIGILGAWRWIAAKMPCASAGRAGLVAAPADATKARVSRSEHVIVGETRNTRRP